ncbi:MAG: cupin domain-containing protein [Aquihabitans sp.]
MTTTPRPGQSIGGGGDHPPPASTGGRRRGIEAIEPTAALIARLSLPSANDPAVAPLHHADLRARTAAVATLETAFPGLPIRRSTQATDATTLTVGHASADLLNAIDGEGLLQRAFQRYTYRPNIQLKLFRDKQPRGLDDLMVTSPNAYPGGRTRARPAGLAAALDDGFTVVLDGVELRDPASVVLTGLFERAFGCEVNVNGYLSSRTHTSFGAHWDDQEVVILQLLGRKDWTIEAPAALSMNRLAHGETVTGQTVWQGRIGPGDAVYVPRGWGHIVNGIDELTFHYTITVQRVNGLHVLDGVLADRDANPTDAERRRPLPMVPGEAAVDPLPPDPATVGQMARRALARIRFGLTRRSTTSLRASLVALTASELDGVLVRCPCPGGWVTVGSTSPDSAPDPAPSDTVIAGMAAQLVAIPRRDVAMVGDLTDGRVHDAGDADPEVVRPLLRLGILEVVPDPTAWGLTRA